jgi:oxygen-independent coproporphyrinogen III oxidase
MRLMCDRRLDYAGLSRELGLDFATVYAPEIASVSDLEADGLVRRTGAGLAVTRLGVPLLRVIAMRFDPTVAASALQHSRTI